METNKAHFWQSPIFWGVLATLLVMFLGVWSFFMPACSLGFDQQIVCTSKWFYLTRATPNEVGDTLAGFAGALAFIWIIVTVAMQSQELGAQREELKLTRDEMIEQRKATQDMARSLAAQASIFEDERTQRNQASAQSLLWSYIDDLAHFAKLHSFPCWGYEIRRENGGVSRGVQYLLEASFLHGSSSREAFENICMGLIRKQEVLVSHFAKDEIMSKPEFDPDVEVLLGQLNRILELEPRLAQPDGGYLARHKLAVAVEALQSIVSTKNWWKEIATE